VLLRSRYEQLLRHLALLGWVLAGTPTLARLLFGPTLSLWLWFIAFVAFAIAFWQNTGTARNKELRGQELSTLASIRRLLLQSLAGLITVIEGEYGFSALFAVIVAMQLSKTFAQADAKQFVPRFMLPHHLETQHLPAEAQEIISGLQSGLQSNERPRVSLRGAVIWVVVQTLGVVFIYSFKVGFLATLPLLVAFLGFQIVVLISNHLATNEKHSREALESVNAELQATQALLANNSRLHERLRISRDLHDLIGHHLTALSLNLEIAQHSEGESQQLHLKKAQALSKMLLADVRETVSTMRNEHSLDLGAVLRQLSEQVPVPKIHLAMPSDLKLNDSGLAQLLVRATQEIISNTIRHAAAEHLFIRLSLAKTTLWLDAFDDGQGMSKVELGNGLRGLHERLAEVGGSVQISSEVGVGTRLKLEIPLASSTREQ
jgi:signal transduction histidine kinase